VIGPADHAFTRQAPNRSPADAAFHKTQRELLFRHLDPYRPRRCPGRSRNWTPGAQLEPSPPATTSTAGMDRRESISRRRPPAGPSWIYPGRRAR